MVFHEVRARPVRPREEEQMAVVVVARPHAGVAGLLHQMRTPALLPVVRVGVGVVDGSPGPELFERNPHDDATGADDVGRDVEEAVGVREVGVVHVAGRPPEVPGDEVPVRPYRRVVLHRLRGAHGDAKRTLPRGIRAVLQEPHEEIGARDVDDDLVAAEPAGKGVRENRRRVESFPIGTAVARGVAGPVERHQHGVALTVGTAHVGRVGEAAGHRRAACVVEEPHLGVGAVVGLPDVGGTGELAELARLIGIADDDDRAALLLPENAPLRLREGRALDDAAGAGRGVRPSFGHGRLLGRVVIGVDRGHA